jgi:hypothetical protein
MKFKANMLAQASGSLAGSVFSHNKGGMYTRNRSIPTNPSSAQQQVVRNAVGQLAARWGSILTVAQRSAWQVYADNVPLVDTLGDSRAVTGQNQYVRSNVPRIQAGLAGFLDAAPTNYNLGSFTTPVVTFTASTDLASIAFTNTDPWASAVGGYMLWWFSRPQSPAINFFKNPFRFAGMISGAASPPASPQTIALPYPIVAGQKVFGYCRVIQVDGRVSTPFRVSGLGV